MKRPIGIGLLLLAFAAGVAVAQYNVDNYTEQGGARTVVGGSLDVVSGGEIDVESGGSFKLDGTAVSSTAAELNALDGITATVTQLNLAASVTDTLIFCGQADESGTIYLGPATVQFFGNDSAPVNVGSAACDALDDGTEGTADAPIHNDVAYHILGGICRTDGTLGSGETVTFTMRTATADTVPAQSCVISEAESDCSITTPTTTAVAAGATVAMKAVQTGDNADDNLWCRATIALQ